MKASIVGELLLLVGLLAVAYLVYTQQEQLVSLELELDKVRGAVGGLTASVPAATNSHEVEKVTRPKPPPPRAKKGSGVSGG